MPVIHIETLIKADIETCFDLARSIDLHLESTKHTGETAIAGRTSGLIEMGETVTWRAKHLGIWQTFTSIIPQMQRPVLFIDEMQRGAFKSLRHEHHFKQVNGGILMTDLLTFQSPLGLLGAIANKLFLTRYLTNLLLQRNEVIKLHAENNDLCAD